MSKSKISILTLSFLLLLMTIYLGYEYKDTESGATTGASEKTQQENPQAPDSSKQQQQQPNSEPGNQGPKSGINYIDSMEKEVALTVNGEDFSTEDFDRRLHKTQFVFKANGLNFQENSEEILRELEETVIIKLIRERVVMQLATEFNIVANDAEVHQRLAATKQNFNEEDWLALLESRGITEEDLNTYNKIQLTEANLINWLGGEQQYVQYLDKKISESEILVNKPLMEELLSKL